MGQQTPFLPPASNRTAGSARLGDRPGQEVILPISEVNALRRAGFLVDPDRKITAPSGGGLHKGVPAAPKPPTGDQEPPAAA